MPSNFDNPRRGSRTYCLKMSMAYGDPIVLQTGMTYRASQKFLDNLELAWRSKGMSSTRSRTKVETASGFGVWFEEEHDQEQE